MQLHELAGRRVAVLGYGKEGQAVSQVLLERVPQAQVTVLCEQPLTAGLSCPMPLQIGAFSAARLSSYEVLIKSPGISLYHPAIQAAVKAGVKVTSGTNLWFAVNPTARVVAITGTKGKSTTAALTAHLLRQAGWQVELAGNIGVPLIARLDVQADIWVLELSSFQVADLHGAPELAILVSLFPEHLDWHGGARQYFADKLRLLSLASQALVEQELLGQLRQHPEWAGRLPARSCLTVYNRTTGWQATGDGLAYAGQAMLSAAEIPVRGRHNHVNACAALTVAEYFGIQQAVALLALKTFQPLPHRLEMVSQSNGVDYVNDSIATTPMATVKALEAFLDRPVILIAGGFDRGLEWAPVVDLIRQQLSAQQGLQLKAVLGLPDNGGALLQGLSAMYAELGVSGCTLEPADDLPAAIEKARCLAQADDVVLLSPGAASFSQFRNFEERGEVFRQLADKKAGP